MRSQISWVCKQTRQYSTYLVYFISNISQIQYYNDTNIDICAISKFATVVSVILIVIKCKKYIFTEGKHVFKVNNHR